MQEVPRNPCLRFGIPTFDDLFGSFSLSHRAYGVPVEEDNYCKLAILGPEGSGKSLLALHLASRYAADVYTRRHASRPRFSLPKILYISTDLTASKAEQMWNAFALNRPNLREVPFYRTMVMSADTTKVDPHHVGLRARFQNLGLFSTEEEREKEDSVAHLLAHTDENRGDEEKGEVRVGFVDFISNPIGDGWSLVARLLAGLEENDNLREGLQKENPADYPDQHLIVIDNIDGFEVMAGEHNAFGDPSSVRARLMQILKAANHKAHVLFVGEERGAGAPHLADICDVVVKLAIREEDGYKYRAIEVQKARAQAIHRGEHYLIIRTGGGSTTGILENPDDPRTTNAYMQVVPSLHTVSRRIMNEPSELKPVSGLKHLRRAGFGLTYLDELCGNARSQQTESAIELCADQNGLQFGTLTAIMGDANTYKSPLGHQFIERGFELFTQKMADLFDDWDASKPLVEESEAGTLLLEVLRHRNLRTTGPPDPKLVKNLKRAFKLVPKTKFAECLAEVLLEHRKGFEEAATVEHVKNLIERKTNRCRHEISVLLAQWAKHVLSNRLLQTVYSPDDPIPPELHAAIPSPFRKNGIDDPVWIAFSSPEGDCGEVLEHAVELYTKDILSRIEGNRHFKRFHRTLRKLHEGRDSMAEIARDAWTNDANVIAPEDDEQTFSSKLVERLSRGSAYEFLRRWFPGSVDQINAKQRRDLQVTTLKAAKFDADLRRRLFVGYAICVLDSRLQEGLVDEEKLRNWFKTIPGFEPLATARVYSGDLICDALCTCLRTKFVRTNADLQAVQDTVKKYLPEGGDPEWSAATLKEALPTLLDYAAFKDPRFSTDTKYAADQFAKWLLGVNPRSHLFAESGSESALSREVQALLLSSTNGDCPVLRAVLAAAALQFVRSGHLEIHSSREDELRARQAATGNNMHLKGWLKEHFKDSCFKKALLCFFECLESGKLEPKGLRQLVAMVSTERGLYAGAEDLLNKAQDTAVRMRVCRLVMEAACREGLMDGPAVLITTSDVRFDDVRARFQEWLDVFTRRKSYQPEEASPLQAEAGRHLRDWLIIRRLEVHYIPTATIAVIIRHCVELAQAALFAPGRMGPANARSWETDVNERRALAWNIRFVLDGLASLKHTYRNVITDSLFLPAIKFYLGRENLTGLVIVSQAGRPDAMGEDAFEREILNLFVNQIRTWRVQFLGEMRVAVTFLPPAPEHGSARVRELFSHESGRVEASPHFELYKGLETGAVERVPLEIRLAGITSGLDSYRASLDALITDVFPAAGTGPDGKPRVVGLESSLDWTDRLRDFGRLHRESHLNHTLILQVDEYWSFRRSNAFRKEWNYLNAACREDDGSTTNDPLEVFQSTLKDPPSNTGGNRYDRFDWSGYAHSGGTFVDELQEAEQAEVDRIPFFWDFGFLLCNRDAWEAARKERLCLSDRGALRKLQGDPLIVGHVWDAMPKIEGQDIKCQAEIPASPRSHPKRDEHPLTSWRWFMEAAAITGMHRSLSRSVSSPALDLQVRGGESLCCLVLEMWASEVYWKFKCREAPPVAMYFDRFSKRSWLPCQTSGLIGLIAEPRIKGSLKKIFMHALAEGRLPDLERHSMELFKALLLLREVLDLASFVGPHDPFTLKVRPVNPAAVCARHWYATACDFLTHDSSDEEFVPVRLPGHISVRGDWYLAVAKGSQSNLLADRALDLLCSRRGNFERLRHGLGLPARKISDPYGGLSPRTRLTTLTKNGRREQLRYDALRKLGAPGTTGPGANEEADFRWLWRSTLGDYDAQARAFRQGVIQFLNWWDSLRRIPGTGWTNGFNLYDKIVEYYGVDATDAEKRQEIFTNSFAVNSLWEFGELCDDLVDRLQRSTPRRL